MGKLHYLQIRKLFCSSVHYTEHLTDNGVFPQSRPASFSCLKWRKAQWFYNTVMINHLKNANVNQSCGFLPCLKDQNRWPSEYIIFWILQSSSAILTSLYSRAFLVKSFIRLVSLAGPELDQHMWNWNRIEIHSTLNWSFQQCTFLNIYFLTLQIDFLDPFQLF